MFMLSETRKTKKRKNGELYRKSKLDILFDIINYTFFISFTLLCLFPFYYILINTISDNGLVRAGKINFIPQGFHLKTIYHCLQ